MGVAGMTVTPDREKEVLFSDSYYSSKAGHHCKRMILEE